MFYDHFLTLCKQKGEKPTPLLKKLGLSPGNLSKWQNGASVNSDILQKLSVYFGVSIDRLVNGTDDTLTTNDEKELLSYYKELDDISKSSVLGKAEGLAEAARRRKAELEAAAKAKVKQKPKAKPLPTPEPEPSEDIDNEEEETEDGYIYLDFPDLPVSAGTGVYLHDDYAEQIKVPANDKTLRANYALRVAGDSMEPRFCDGDIVLVETQPSVEIGEVGIFIYEGEAYIKEFGGDRLISLNPKYKDIKITDPSSLYCKGRVFSVLDPIKNKYN